MSTSLETAPNPIEGMTAMQYVHQQIQRIFTDLATHIGGDGEDGIHPMQIVSAEMTLHDDFQGWCRDHIGSCCQLGDWPKSPSPPEEK